MTHAALRGFAAACLATSCLVGIVTEAQAQIEEIVVTTRKRAENLQEVPIVVTAFTSETLERKGLADLKDVIKYTAGVQLDEGFSAQDTRVVIRGLSPTRGRPNVAFLMDDVDISSEAIQTGGSSLLINPRLFDLERVEIVKGPHSALYGRSAFAGAINYITKKPGDEFEGSVSLDAATYGDFEAKAGISGPVVDGILNMGLNIAGWSQDGFYDNSVTKKSIGGGEGAGIATSAVFTPNDDLKATFRVEYSSDHFDPQARTHIGATLAPIPTAALVLANPRLNGQYLKMQGSAGSVSSRALVPTISTDPRTGEDYTGNQRQIFRTSLRFDYETSFATLSSISHYGTGRVHQFEDAQRQGDFNNLTIAAETNFNTHTRLMSEEFRATSNQDGPLNWVAGALWWNEEVWQDSRSFTCFVPTGSACGPLVRQVGTSRPSTPEIYGRDTLHYSAYALAEYKITDQLGLSVEIRHSWEKEGLLAPATVSKGIGCASPFRSLQADNVTLRCSGVTATQNLPFTNPTFNNTVAAGINPVTKSDFWAPRFGLDYKATDDILLYASASKGIKPGGVSTVSGGASGIDAAANAYQAEKLWVYEVGTKTSWLDNTLQFNASGYYQDFSGKQVSTQILLSTGSTGSRILNASSARVWGVDLEGGIAVNDNLSFSAAYTWLDAKYNDFVITNNSLGTIVNAGNCTASTIGTPPAFTCLISRTGNKLEDTPTHSLQFSPNWTAPLSGDVNYFIEATVLYTSKRFESDDNDFFFPSYWNTDLRIGFNNEAAGWEVVGYVNNLFDDDKLKTGFASPDFLRSNCLGGPPCNIPGIGAGAFNFVLPSHATVSLPDKRQFGIRAKYSF